VAGWWRAGGQELANVLILGLTELVELSRDISLLPDPSEPFFFICLQVSSQCSRKFNFQFSRLGDFQFQVCLLRTS
jgi:hypothetical protein